MSSKVAELVKIWKYRAKYFETKASEYHNANWRDSEFRMEGKLATLNSCIADLDAALAEQPEAGAPSYEHRLIERMADSLEGLLEYMRHAKTDETGKGAIADAEQDLRAAREVLASAPATPAYQLHCPRHPKRNRREMV